MNVCVLSTQISLLENVITIIALIGGTHAGSAAQRRVWSVIVTMKGAKGGLML
jgi:hypothetical protein